MLEAEFGTLEEVLEAISASKRLEEAQHILSSIIIIASPVVRNRARFKSKTASFKDPSSVLDYVDELVHIIHRQEETINTLLKINEIKDGENSNLKDLLRIGDAEKAREKIRGWDRQYSPPPRWKHWEEPSEDDCKGL